MAAGKQGLLLAYYGDDFTGSTDALEFLSRAGARTVLFMDPPGPEQLAAYPGLQAIGVAGRSRALAPAEMAAELQPAFAALRSLQPRHVHYKVCSTFDSSSRIGSIGQAIEVGAEIFPAPVVPLLVAAPELGRHCVFGNLFARMGIGSQGGIYRLDRHPAMQRHPVTPADESDLRLHLARQTSRQIGLIDILQVARPEPEIRVAVQQALAAGAEILLFDALYPEQMGRLGGVLDHLVLPPEPLFSVGSSGIEMALGKHWQETGLLRSSGAWPDPGPATPLLVASGSCSPVTAAQIAWALNQGFAEVPLDTAALAREAPDERLLDGYVATVAAQVQAGKSVIIHTSRGTGDARMAASAAILEARAGNSPGIQSRTAELYGTALGQIVRGVLAQTHVSRVVIAGGDTSSYAARALGIAAVEMIAPLAPGAPLCRAQAPGSPADGLEVNFKGGQVGKEDYFGMAARGKALN